MSYSEQDLAEFIVLAELAGVHAVPGVFKILIELLSLQISPEDIYVLLKRISPLPQQRKKNSSATKSKSIKYED